MAPASWMLRYTGHLGVRGPDTPLFRHSARSIDPVDQIRFIADLGLAGVQDNFLKMRPPAQQERIGAELARQGLAMGSFTNNPTHWNQPLWNAENAEARALLRHDLEQSIATARRINGGIATCVTGLDPARPHAPQRAMMIENLKRLADTAASGGITLCVEAVAAAAIPGLLLAHIKDAAAVVRAVDHPAVRLLFDFGHVQVSDGNVLTHFEHNRDLLGAIQVADTPGRIDLGAGELDWPRILTTVRASGWTGLIELEYMPEQDSAAGEERLLQRLRVIDDTLRRGSAIEPGAPQPVLRR